jgi:hypothetical protein
MEKFVENITFSVFFLNKSVQSNTQVAVPDDTAFLLNQIDNIRTVLIFECRVLYKIMYRSRRCIVLPSGTAHF